MSHPTQSFPAFDEWQKMSESEQDALLDRLETASERGSLIRHVLVGVLCVTACATGAMLLMMRP